jgi:hypothetical protein
MTTRATSKDAGGGEIDFAAVDDVQNTLRIWALRGDNENDNEDRI